MEELSGVTAKTMSAGSFQANAFGLHDMHGNVREWCQDARHDIYLGAAADGTARLKANVSIRVFRGGSWNSDDHTALRSAARRFGYPNVQYNDVGIRLARTISA